MPFGMQRLIESVTTNSSTESHAEQLGAICELAAETAGGHATATADWLTQKLAVALADADGSMLLRIMTVINVIIRSGTPDLASATAACCKPVVLAVASFDPRTSGTTLVRDGLLNANVRLPVVVHNDTAAADLSCI